MLYNKRTQANPRPIISTITRDQWDLKEANLILNALKGFFNPITFTIGELDKNTYAHFLTDATYAMKMNHGPRPKEGSQNHELT